MGWIRDNWTTIMPVILAVLALIDGLIQRSKKGEALSIANVLITAIETLNSVGVKREARAESVRQDVAKPMATMVTKVTDAIKAEKATKGGAA